ncbi:MAG: ABC transporter permease subunit [Candidatus Eisenbacteria bacterium]|nr:ABC transporter permease subunit [Candidatus Eisenbacteria bacterium]
MRPEDAGAQALSWLAAPSRTGGGARGRAAAPLARRAPQRSRSRSAHGGQVADPLPAPSRHDDSGELPHSAGRGTPRRPRRTSAPWPAADVPPPGGAPGCERARLRDRGAVGRAGGSGRGARADLAEGGGGPRALVVPAPRCVAAAADDRAADESEGGRAGGLGAPREPGGDLRTGHAQSGGGGGAAAVSCGGGARMRAVLTLARHTVLDAMRERAFLTLGVFAFLTFAASQVVTPLALGEERRVTLDLGLGMLSLFGFLLVLFLGTRMVQKEIDRKTILLLLAKPLHRSELVVGKYVGLAAVLLISVTGMLAALALVLLSSGHSFGWSLGVAGYYAVLELWVIAALTMLLTAFSSPVLATFFLVGIYIAGHLASSLIDAAEMLPSALGAMLLKGLFLVIPRLDLYSYTLEVVHGAAIRPAELLWATAYALLYAGGAILASLLIFRRREFS